METYASGTSSRDDGTRVFPRCQTLFVVVVVVVVQFGTVWNSLEQFGIMMLRGAVPGCELPHSAGPRTS
eukprot:736485-Prorocentrum_minimum.AAC.1